MIIDGKKIEKRETFDVINPYTKKTVGKAGIADEEDVVKAIQLSFNVQKNLTVEQRFSILKTAAEKIKEQKSEIASLITSESGLCLKDTMHEVDRVCNVLNDAADTVYEIEKDSTRRFIMGENRNPELKVISEPLDLVLGITPFNHPMNQVAHKVAPAVAAGTSIVVKPSEKTPLSAIKFVEILHESGLPANFVNLVTTDKPGEFLDFALKTKLPQMITFTGGVKVGKIIFKKMAETENENIKYLPELGGNSALIILEDADIDKAAEISMSIFTNSGQRCTTARRVILHNKIAPRFIERFLEKVKGIKYGNPSDISADMGTLINEEAAKEVQDRINLAIEDGAQLLYGNVREGALLSPTVLDNVKIKSKIVKEETFGPVASIIRVNNLEEAVLIANNTPYKLAGAVVTQDEKKAEIISNSIKVGQFNWNSYPGYRIEKAPFGGFGLSGNGQKEGVVLAAEGMRRVRTFYKH